MEMVSKKQIARLTIIAASVILSSQAIASDFSLPFVNAAGLGDLYSDWASSASDASTAYTNPAGLVKLGHQQVVFAALGLTGNTKFTGTTTTSPTVPLSVLTGSASSRLGAIMPSFYYAYPINNQFTFGFSETTPFALGTNYPKDSIVRYTATLSRVVAVDLSPSIGMKVSDKFSVGLGLDATRLAFTLNSMFGPPLSIPDAESQNHLYGWGYGWHGGVLYQVLPCTRVGVNYNSMMMFHSTGSSEVYSTTVGNWRVTNQKSNAPLPARAQLSIHQDINPCWSVAGTFFYTNWKTFQQLTLKRVVLPFPGGPTTSVTIPFNYHNTFDYAIGTNYKVNSKWLVRAGLELMTTPSNDRNRSVPDPIGSATIIGIGARYEQNPCLTYDVGIAHSFFKQEPINSSTPLSATSGHTNTQTSLVGGQVTWNIT